MHLIGKLMVGIQKEKNVWDKTKDILTDVKLVLPIMFILWSGTSFAFTTYMNANYLTLASYSHGTIQQLQREIAELKHRLLYAQSSSEKKMLQGLILIKEQQIKEVK